MRKYIRTIVILTLYSNGLPDTPENRLRVLHNLQKRTKEAPGRVSIEKTRRLAAIYLAVIQNSFLATIRDFAR